MTPAEAKVRQLLAADRYMVDGELADARRDIRAAEADYRNTGVREVQVWQMLQAGKVPPGRWKAAMDANDLAYEQLQHALAVRRALYERRAKLQSPGELRRRVEVTERLDGLHRQREARA
jgi:hypothetical protein